MEVAIERVIQLVKEQEQNPTLESDYASDSEDVSRHYEATLRTKSHQFLSMMIRLCFQSPIIQCNMELTTAVRKELAMALRDLMQHGLIEVGVSLFIMELETQQPILNIAILNYFSSGWSKQQHCSFWMFPNPLSQK